MEWKFESKVFGSGVPKSLILFNCVVNDISLCFEHCNDCILILIDFLIIVEERLELNIDKYKVMDFCKKIIFYYISNNITVESVESIKDLGLSLNDSFIAQ